MELELGFKISKTLDDYSSADLRISKDRAGPVFVYRETDTMFVLTAHLKGYKKDYMKIEVNKDGTRIAISGERTVQEMVMINWQMNKKEPEMRGFRKTFNIPEGVNLDKIKAKFNKDESVLTISMPKLVKGLHGLKIAEITKDESLHKPNTNLTKESDEIVSEVSPNMENNNKNGEKDLVSDEFPCKENERGVESDNLKEKSIIHEEYKGKDEGEDGEREKGESVIEKQENEEMQSNEKGFKLCVPMIAGTAFIVSIIVFVMQMIRDKNVPKKSKS